MTFISQSHKYAHTLNVRFCESDLRLSRSLKRLFEFLILFAFPFSSFLFFLLQYLTFYWACFQFKTFWESIIEKGNFYHGVATWSEIFKSFSINVLSILVHISGSIESITLIWVSLERSFPPAEVEHRWWNSDQGSSRPPVTGGTTVNNLTCIQIRPHESRIYPMPFHTRMIF